MMKGVRVTSGISVRVRVGVREDESILHYMNSFQLHTEWLISSPGEVIIVLSSHFLSLFLLRFGIG